MNEFVYIKQDVPGYYTYFLEKLEPEYYNNLGETFDDYLENKWVLLSEEQVIFKDENPQATVQEVWDMVLNPPYEPTLDEVKFHKVNELMTYDQSDEVNSFTINNMISAWFTAA